MNQKFLLKTFFYPLTICGAFIICTGLGMVIEPDAFHKFFSPYQLIREIPPQLPNKSYYWDVEHYANMALNLRCTAFYPLWPLIIRTLFNSQSLDWTAHFLSLVATVLFFITTPLLFWVFKIALNRSYLAFILMLAFTLNPMAIFRVNGYTESWFTTLSLVFIWLLLPQIKLKQQIKIAGLFVIVFFMALSRPILLQIVFSSAVSLLTLLFFEHWKQKPDSWGDLFNLAKQKYQTEIVQTLTIWFAALLGYSIYGNFCLTTRGDFLAPFNDQKLWGKSLGLHLDLLLFPKSLLFDLLGLYFPIIVLIVSLILVFIRLTNKQLRVFAPKLPLWNILFFYPPTLIILYGFNYLKLKLNPDKTGLKTLKPTNYTASLSENYLFWFCVYFPAVHAAIVFFSQDRLFSLGRFVFAVPFLFLAVGYVYRCLPGRKNYYPVLWMIFISAIALILQWVTYGQDGWLG